MTTSAGTSSIGCLIVGAAATGVLVDSPSRLFRARRPTSERSCLATPITHAPARTHKVPLASEMRIYEPSNIGIEFRDFGYIRAHHAPVRQALYDDELCRHTGLQQPTLHSHRI